MIMVFIVCLTLALDLSKLPAMEMNQTLNAKALPKQILPNEEIFRRERLTKDDFKKIVRNMGLKVTQQRMIILSTLHNGRQHLTAQEVFENVHAVHPEIGFATVYRFLRKLAEHKLVTELRMGGLPARYELTPTHHHDHLTCTKCGKIIEFENFEIERLQLEIAKNFKFKLENHVLELYGICNEGFCQERKIL